MLGWFKKKKPEKSASDFSDKRKAERLYVTDDTELFAPEEVHKITLKDISKTGVRFVSDALIPKNTVIKIKINYYPIDFPLRVNVIWSKKVSEMEFEHGAEFVNVPQDEMNMLLDHLDLIRESLQKNE
jgi:hypothetical protein